MRHPPLESAGIEFDAGGVPISTLYGDRYHPEAGALQQAREVFLRGCGLPDRWRGRPRFTVLETGFGLGHNFLATWQAWRDDPDRPQQLQFVSIERHPVATSVLDRVHATGELQTLSEQLRRLWPHPTPDFHRLTFEDGAVVLLLVHADVEQALRELRLQADAIYLDGFAPARNPQMWTLQVLKAIGRLAAQEATLSTWCAAGAVRRGLLTAGFDVTRQTGFAGKRERTEARYRPRPGMRKPLPSPGVGEDDPVLIVGAGLAGAACARALSMAGRPCIVLDRHAEPAQEASGNPVGLFHGVVHPEDGAHARFNRAAALIAERSYRPLIEAGLIPGAIGSLLRLEDRRDLHAMQLMLQAQSLPPGYVQAVSVPPRQLPRDPQKTQDGWAEQTSGMTPDEGGRAPAAWHYPGGGWLSPCHWVRWALQAPRISFIGGVEVARLDRDGSRWIARDRQGNSLATSSQVVLCSAGIDLLRDHLEPSAEPWRTGRQRGQITGLPANTPGLAVPPVPIAGGGYVVRDDQGFVWCGATATPADPDPQVRADDHLDNLHKLAQITGQPVDVDLSALKGRVGWRFLTPRRLPLVGPVSDAAGLYVATALGSRGITWAPLVGEVIAHWVTGSAPPLPASLLDAIDPRRAR